MSNKPVVIITGASSGIGLACAIEFARNGYSIVMQARDAAKLSNAAIQLNIDVNEILQSVGDVSIQQDCERLINEAIEKFGRIDVLINNAGITMRGLFHEMQAEVLIKVMNVNFMGTVYCTHYAFPHLLKSKGVVVGISSVAGYKGLPGRSAYAASKFAVEGLLETIRIENLYTGLHVLIARPGFTNTNIRNTAVTKDGSPSGQTFKEESKMMSAEVVAKHIFNGVKKRKNYVILTSVAILTFWINKFFPKLVDRLVHRHVENEKNSPLKK